MKSPLRASEDVLASSMQSTPAVPSAPHFASLPLVEQCEPPEADAETYDVWNVWPYTWAIAGHEIATDRFHSFHKNLNAWRLARHNRRVLQQHRAQLQGWSCEAGARLVD